MPARKSHGKRVSDRVLAILLFAGLSQLQPLSLRNVRRRQARDTADHCGLPAAIWRPCSYSWMPARGR